MGTEQHTRKLRQLVVVGNGMVGHHFVKAAIDAGLSQDFAITVVSEEPRLAYDRVNLSKFFEGKGALDLMLADAEDYREKGIAVIADDPVIDLDRPRRALRTRTGTELHYDKLVLATGSRPFVPLIAGSTAARCFVYRTLEDLEAIKACASTCKVGVVIGGGLLGLEAANALRLLGLETHVVEFAPRLMPLQVDQLGGHVLRTRIEQLGVKVHVGKNTQQIVEQPERGVTGLAFADGSLLETDMVVFSAGIRARHELAERAGLALGERGGIAIDALCTTTDPNVLAIGECASLEGRTYGLVAPGYRMAETAVSVLRGTPKPLPSFDMNTKLKLLGVDVASFGDAQAQTRGCKEISLLDTVAGTYKKLVVSADHGLLLGGIMVGDATNYAELASYQTNRIKLPSAPEQLIVAEREGGKKTGFGIDALPEAAMICSCHNVDKAAICRAIRDNGLTAVGAVKSCTKAGTGCGSCVTLVSDLLKSELKRAGVAVTNHLCEHFPHSRQELMHLVRIERIESFADLIAKHGRGRGCEICKPAVASILASNWNAYILEPKHAVLQDTNDRFLANIQRDGSYSIVPRLAGGEVTPRQLTVLGQVAEKYGLYAKVTGGQRIDLFGARVDQLPDIWRELVDAGFESGHAYGKALRTVKSCVGSTWCRYGVQDSVGLAVLIENRYKGLRSPHKLKSAVSGCARECAEAQGKDFGIIATDKGFNLYVCGNGGMKPQHAVLLASDLDIETLIRYIDRFLMFYVRTADRLQRTATWFNNLEGGIAYLREVIVEDSLGIGQDLEAQMQHLVDTYQCEWKTTVNDPERLKMFRPFVNTKAPDPSVVMVKERAQHRPANWVEKKELIRSGKIRLPMAHEAEEVLAHASAE